MLQKDSYIIPPHWPIYISKNRPWFVGGKTTQVKTFDGFVKPSGLCVANDQLVVVDRGAHQVHWQWCMDPYWICGVFFQIKAHQNHRNVWFSRTSMFFLGVFCCWWIFRHPQRSPSLLTSPLCLSASTLIPFALVRLELLPHVGMTCIQYESGTELLQLHTIRKRFTKVVSDWWVTALIKSISLMFVFKFADLLQFLKKTDLRCPNC